ncbi:RNA-binding protein Raly isoform X2 [Syngnathoides biaculeatus]|uniref:RNA-binding protein Raly isoform X2 n=1 Tax=Syngnathoides biaculeatus TaxID=300417 RepID=UPI002ADDD69E|nr:RNA-binding protein Raly isoform X2 [Syngnathoides biaculeatus]
MFLADGRNAGPLINFYKNDRRASGVSSSSSGIMSSPVRPSNVTNRRDAESVASRVFIGNLNTALVSKRHVAAVFSAYGRVLGCSVHKGFAFVQYASRGHARAAVSGHDGRVLAGQALDVNMAGEAKPDPDLPGASFYLQLRTDLDRRLFDFHGRAPPPVVRGAPPLVKWPRASSLPARLRPQNVNVLHAKATAGRRVQLQVIKSQLTQIKANVDALLGRLEHIAERAHARDAGDACAPTQAGPSHTESRGDDDDDDDKERRSSGTEKRLADGKSRV